MTKQLTFLRIALVIIFLVHSVSGIFDNGINDFGNFFLNKVGFAPFGVPLAWAIKLSHIGLVFSLFTDKFLKINSIITILVLIAGIIMVHWPDGWFVVGGGRNGIEFNFLLIMALLSINYPDFFSNLNRK